MPALLEPTQEQRAILACSAPVAIIQAAAGTGKTTTLALLAAQALGKGVPPGRVLVLAKTAAAVVAMRQALRAVGLSSAQAKAVQVQTIEQLSRRILTVFEACSVPAVNTFEALTAPAWQAMEWLVERTDSPLQESFRTPSNTGASRDDGWIEAYVTLAHRFQGGLQFLDEEGSFRRDADIAADPQVADVQVALWFKAFTLQSRAARLDAPPAFRAEGDASFDLARYCLCSELSPASHAVPGNLSLVLLDEMHDLNAAAYEVIKLAMKANPKAQLVGVGDRDQVIYGHDAADEKFMNPALLSEDLGRAAQALSLTASFRYGATLSGAINRLLPDKCRSLPGTRTAVVFCADAGSSHAGDDPALQEVLARYEGQPRATRQLAIILRHGYQSFAVENALIKAQVPYELSGLVSCFEWPEVMLVRGIVAVAGARITDAAGSEVVRRGIIHAFDQFARPAYSERTLSEAGATTRADYVAHAADAAAASEQVIRQFLDNTLLASGFCDKFVVNCLRAARDLVADKAGKGDQATVADIADALQLERLVAHAFVAVSRRQEVLSNMRLLQGMADQQGSLVGFFHYLNQQERRREALSRTHQRKDQLAQFADGAVKRKTSVSLYHVDAVKGLEFSDVYVPYANWGEFPAPEGTSNEERNRVYVALSRAKERLTVSAQGGRESAWFLALKTAGTGLPAT